MYNREKLRKALEKCFQISDKVEARLQELQRQDSEYKCGKRDAAASKDKWSQVLVERAFIRAKMKRLEQILSVLVSNNLSK